ncbi:hypothetical protein RF11_03157 [Thelohanellus kitauei]|uniref:Uncharacterized protein n=1 Tax=Thelohanellus kitauei TaxID=669202 RepID=A0A0C2NFF0_THEKT|nr:hypothetical protein RF11_03157 [Thelohanellus kitauei]
MEIKHAGALYWRKGLVFMLKRVTEVGPTDWSNVWTDLFAIFGQLGPFSLANLSLHTDRSWQAKLGHTYQFMDQFNATPTPSETSSSSIQALGGKQDPNNIRQGDLETAAGRVGRQERKEDCLSQNFTLLAIRRPYIRMQEGVRDPPEAVKERKSLEGLSKRVWKSDRQPCASCAHKRRRWGHISRSVVRNRPHSLGEKHRGWSGCGEPTLD